MKKSKYTHAKYSNTKQTNTKHSMARFGFLTVLALGLSTAVVGGFTAWERYQGYKYQQLVEKATIKPVKVFQIGFSKCGTSTISNFFNINGVPSVHHDEGLLPISIYQNALNNRPLLSPKYEKFAVFTDMERLYGNPPINIPLTLFKELDQQYPGSKFILNTRDKQAWLLSRATQPIMPNATPLLQMHANMLNKTQDEVLAMWSKEWDEHHQAVLEYFKDRPQDLLVFNIETDKPEKFVEFFKEYFILDPKLFGHKNKAASRAKEMKRERQVVEIFSKTYPLKPQQ